MKAQQQGGTDYRHDECRFLGFSQCCSRQCFGDLWSSFPRAHLSGWTASISAARSCQSVPGSSRRNCARGFIASSETGRWISRKNTRQARGRTEDCPCVCASGLPKSTSSKRQTNTPAVLSLRLGSGVSAGSPKMVLASLESTRERSGLCALVRGACVRHRELKYRYGVHPVQSSHLGNES